MARAPELRSIDSSSSAWRSHRPDLDDHAGEGEQASAPKTRSIVRAHRRSPVLKCLDALRLALTSSSCQPKS